jgi:hypothetical protein
VLLKIFYPSAIDPNFQIHFFFCQETKAWTILAGSFLHPHSVVANLLATVGTALCFFLPEAQTFNYVLSWMLLL